VHLWNRVPRSRRGRSIGAVPSEASEASASRLREGFDLPRPDFGVHIGRNHALDIDIEFPRGQDVRVSLGVVRSLW